MTIDKLAIVSRLGTSEAPEIIELAASFVIADDTQLVSDKSGRSFEALGNAIAKH